jgi:hypothetical protein
MKMANWNINISGKNIRKASVEKLANLLKEEFGEGSFVRVTDSTPPESRSERFSSAMEQISDARTEIECLRDELQDWLDNLPENLQSGMKADELQEAIDTLEEISGEIDSIENADLIFPGMY